MRLTTCLAHLAFATLMISPAYAQDAEAATDAPTVVEATADEPAVAESAEASADAEAGAEAAVAEASGSRDASAAVAADADTDAAGAGAAPGDEAEASAPPAIASAVNIPAPPAGKGQVVFFREKKFAGSAVRFKVRENDEELGKLGSGVYFIHVTDPGVHEYVVHSEAKDALTLEVEDGETYYVSGSITMGLLVGRPNLSPADEGAFAAAADKLSPAKE